MPYCTQTDLLKMIPAAELAQLTAESGDTPDAAVVAAAIAQADGEIDSYLAVPYQVPLNPVPERVRDLSVDLALYYLYRRRGVTQEVRRQAYEDAVAFLKLVGQSKAQIVGASGAEVPSEPVTVTEISSQPRVFDRDKMGGW